MFTLAWLVILRWVAILCCLCDVGLVVSFRGFFWVLLNWWLV